ncbi:MAG: DUF3817 domain-containing protein [Akkermansiaceae bacterium]|nr:DUF3817 domain-containing protein [Akkermansiaceae bacterium]
MFEFRTPMDRVRTLGRIEGVSFILLLGIAMPLRTYMGMDKAVTYVGWAHGILFIALALVTFIAWRGEHLSFKQSCLVAIGALLPFGPFVVERWLPGTSRIGMPIQVPPHITRGLFVKWRDVRRGSRPAEDLSNPYWSWLIESETSSYAANDYFRGPSSYMQVCEGGEAAWSAERLGQSETELADGRIVLVAGEHEDHYDPDFFIYNDLIIRHPHGRIQILGYPREVFPPTDFHSTTLVDGKLVVIGNLGYSEQRQAGVTQVLVIDPETWEVRQHESTGEGPGWIHDHRAELRDGAIVLSGGKVWVGEEEELIENFDDWQLDLGSWKWKRIAQRKVSIHIVEREDGEEGRLFELSMWESDQLIGGTGFSFDIPKEQWRQMSKEEQKEMKAMRKSMRKLKDLTPELDDHAPPADIEAYQTRYQPGGINYHKLEPDEDDFPSALLQIDGVRVRYQEETMGGVKLIIEGELPRDTEQALVEDLVDKLSRADGAPYKARRLLA